MEFIGIKKVPGLIGNNSLLVFSGMQLNRAPMAVVHELIKKDYGKKKRYRIVTTPNPIPTDMLIGAGLVSELEFCFIGFKYEYGFVLPKHFRNAIEKRKIKYKETGAFSIMQGLRAGAMGLPFMAVPGFEKSDLSKDYKRVIDPYTNKEVIVRPSIIPDFAIIHAQAADRKGNIYIEDPLNEWLLCKAAKNVIVSVEEIIEPVWKKPDIPYLLVDYIIKSPKGANPCSCYKHYNYDICHIKDFAELDFEDYFNRYIVSKE